MVRIELFLSDEHFMDFIDMVHNFKFIRETSLRNYLKAKIIVVEGEKGCSNRDKIEEIIKFLKDYFKREEIIDDKDFNFPKIGG